MSQAVKEFVLLRHDLLDTRHWDLMLDMGETLASWQILQDPLSEDFAPGSVLPARRLGDHRRGYLTYEGPVSRGRGQVTRTDGGAYFLLVRQVDLWTIRLAGRVLRGTFLLSAASGPLDQWQFQRLDE